MRGFIHVHHVTPLHKIRSSYFVNPQTDLIPVCPNCHAVIHSKREPLSIEEMRQLLKKGEQGSGLNDHPPSRPVLGRFAPGTDRAVGQS